ncbi:MAG: hypothetical protein HY291_11455 [Planctomycetes bacterium]|nr:hypothetical protein [Planctomycetota bacterium]
MDSAALWSELGTRAKALETIASAEVADWPAVRAACDELLPQVRALTEEAAREVAGRLPDWAERIRERTAEPASIEEAEAPVVLYGGAQEGDVAGAWVAQFQDQVRAAAAFVRNDRPVWSDWMMGWTEGHADRLAFFRAEHLRDCLKEIRKLAALLSAPRRVERVARRARVFADEPGAGLACWRCFGPGHFAREGASLRMDGAGNTAWCAHDFEGGVVAFEFQPLLLEGPGAGALFAFPAVPLKGQGYAVSAGEMTQYNYGLDTYHVSLCRGDSGMTNLRRTCRGLRMLSTVKPDPCRELGRTYRVEMLQHGRSAQVFVDGRLTHAYVDGGTYGAPRVHGRFGIRHFSAARMAARYGMVEGWTLG